MLPAFCLRLPAFCLRLPAFCLHLPAFAGVCCSLWRRNWTLLAFCQSLLRCKLVSPAFCRHCLRFAGVMQAFCQRFSLVRVPTTRTVTETLSYIMHTMLKFITDLAVTFVIYFYLIKWLFSLSIFRVNTYM